MYYGFEKSEVGLSETFNNLPRRCTDPGNHLGQLLSLNTPIVDQLSNYNLPVDRKRWLYRRFGIRRIAKNMVKGRSLKNSS
jgi:hypothetical protein